MVYEVRCSAAHARRILSLGSLQVGFPLPNGEWSIRGEQGFTHGDKVRLRLMSEGGSKIHAERDAEVLDCRKGNEGCFIAYIKG